MGPNGVRNMRVLWWYEPTASRNRNGVSDRTLDSDWAWNDAGVVCASGRALFKVDRRGVIEGMMGESVYGQTIPEWSLESVGDVRDGTAREAERGECRVIHVQAINGHKGIAIGGWGQLCTTGRKAGEVGGVGSCEETQPPCGEDIDWGGLRERRHPTTTMKSLRSAALLSIAFLASATAHSTRKSLNFGPRHPTARYVTEPQVTSTFMATSTDPYDVAKSFLSAYTTSDYFIREDSYTDRNTGVTHVYVRQKVDGLEVADGDMNLNIRDGRVLSYGDSVGILLFFSDPLLTSL
ncbi:FTP domain-containing protein [Rhizoctonia solani AG-1 IA]|uniref:FTP domain-containing protein n=1 Tax=Thanatephorus cucumeris (strain AG1-IA) TaxID=983506 RepID=L8WS03_THACA|nr:FTP domain-containing protein [Rhizoctonia solani AG-1 IA]